MVKSNLAAPLLLAACAMSSPLDCGEAIGKDNSHDADAIAACKACKGEKAFIDWYSNYADGLGYSYCSAGTQLSSSLDCGEAIFKDNSHDAAAIAACKACKGDKAYIDWRPNDADGLGYSYCLAGTQQLSSLDCGEAIHKDNSHDAAAIAACKACKGEKSYIDWQPYDADGLGYSYCRAMTELSSSLDCGEAVYKDNSHDTAAIAACKACKGEKAYIDWQPYDADGLGYSYCRAGAQLSTPPACGEAYAKDTSHDADSIAACKACRGPTAVLIYDGGMLDSIGMTYCQAANNAGFLV